MTWTASLQAYSWALQAAESCMDGNRWTYPVVLTSCATAFDGLARHGSSLEHFEKLAQSLLDFMDERCRSRMIRDHTEERVAGEIRVLDTIAEATRVVAESLSALFAKEAITLCKDSPTGHLAVVLRDICTQIYAQRGDQADQGFKDARRCLDQHASEYEKTQLEYYRAFQPTTELGRERKAEFNGKPPEPKDSTMDGYLTNSLT